jgi:hypothetical protein
MDTDYIKAHTVLNEIVREVDNLKLEVFATIGYDDIQ